MTRGKGSHVYNSPSEREAALEVERLSTIYQSKLAERYLRERDEAVATLREIAVLVNRGQIEGLTPEAVNALGRADSVCDVLKHSRPMPSEREAIVSYIRKWPDEEPTVPPSLLAMKIERGDHLPSAEGMGG